MTIMGHTKDLLQEDWEREHLKDSLYLLEEKMRIEAEYYSSIKRKPAKIVVVNKLKKKEENEAEHNTLPF
jgi:hypothetical protein